MLGKSLSAWTLSWFASGLLALLLSLALALATGISPSDFSRPEALAVIHVFALGWLTQVMLGALIQFIPVLAARPLVWPRLALPALLACSIGTVMLAIGFLSLDGRKGTASLFLFAPALLGVGFVMVVG